MRRSDDGDLTWLDLLIAACTIALTAYGSFVLIRWLADWL